MKFELPLDMVMVADVSPHDLSNDHSVMNTIVEQDFIPKYDEMAGIEDLFQFMKISIDKNTEEKITRLLEKRSESLRLFQEKIDRDRVVGKSTSDWIQQKFRRDVEIQSSQVDALIEAERKRRKLEEERRRAEAEKNRLKELERKQKEEEQKKKLEEQKKQLEEQKRKEEEAKKKAAELEREAQEAKRKAEEQKARTQLEARKKQLEEEEAKKAEEQLQKDTLERQKTYKGSDFEAIKKEFLKYKQDIADIKANVVQKVSANANLKKAVSQLKRKINPKFGQLSLSNQQFQRINSELISLILSAKPEPLAFNWILNFVAKAIVDQAETEVIVQTAAAVPLAKLAYSLLQQFPELEYYLSARFVKKCPLIIGFTRSIDTEEGRLQMGWKRRDNKWEDDVKYDERLSGICTLWAEMTRTPINGSQLPFYGFESSWRFLARMMNTDTLLLTNVHFSVAANWWEAAARDFFRTYGNQAKKLMFALSVTFTDSVKDKKFPGAARILILGDDFFINQKVEGLPEMTM